MDPGRDVDFTNCDLSGLLVSTPEARDDLFALDFLRTPLQPRVDDQLNLDEIDDYRNYQQEVDYGGPLDDDYVDQSRVFEKGVLKTDSDEDLTSESPQWVIPQPQVLCSTSQAHQWNLEPDMTVEELVAYGLGLKKPKKVSDDLTNTTGQIVAANIAAPPTSQSTSGAGPLVPPKPSEINIVASHEMDLPGTGQEPSRNSKRPLKRKKYMEDPDNDPSGKIKNAINAKKNREKQKNLIKDLQLRAENAEKTLNEKENENAKLSSENAELSSEIERMKEELSQLRASIEEHRVKEKTMNLFYSEIQAKYPKYVAQVMRRFTPGQNPNDS